MLKIGIINYGSGNFRSVWNAFEYLGIPSAEIREPRDALEVSSLVLPGVGSFERCMKRLRSTGLDTLIRENVSLGKPFLGICVGMQVLADRGFEFGDHDGLGLIAGVARRIECGTLRLPHIGWNTCKQVGNTPLLSKDGETDDYYFLHSFHLDTAMNEDRVAVTEYGEEIVSIVQRENVFGVQFHPEKSQRAGLNLIERFALLN